MFPRGIEKMSTNMKEEFTSGLGPTPSLPNPNKPRNFTKEFQSFKRARSNDEGAETVKGIENKTLTRSETLARAYERN